MATWNLGGSAFPRGQNFSGLPALDAEDIEGATKLDVSALVAMHAYVVSKGVANIMKESDLKVAAKWAYKMGNEMVAEKLRIEAM